MIVTVLFGASKIPRPSSEIIQAAGFQLVDEAGLVRGKLRMGEDGPTLVLLDVDGNERVDLFDSAEATALYLRDREGQPRVGAAQFAHGGGGFALHGPEGVGTSVLYMQGTGPGRLSYYESTGTETYRFPPAD